MIAVGHNNFQAGSRVVRLRTYNKDGRPELGNGRVPTNFINEDSQAGAAIDSSDEGTSVRGHAASVETATPEAAPAMAREASSGGQRRSTGGRRHSPSTASEQPPLPISADTGESLEELTERFKALKSEHQNLATVAAKEKEEFDTQMAELTKERDEKRVLLKEKEEASEKLKKEANIAERRNRQAQNRKANVEKALREKKAERQKMLDDMARWATEIEDMKTEREQWERDRKETAESTDKKCGELREILRQRQNSLNGMEEEMRVRGLQIRELEDERKKLPGAEDDEEAAERDAAERQKDAAWELRERDLMHRFTTQTGIFQQLKANLEQARAYQAVLLANQTNAEFMYGASSTGVELDSSSQHRAKSRRGRQHKSPTNAVSSPVSAQPVSDTQFSGAAAYNDFSSSASPSWAQGPYIDLNAATGMSAVMENMTESEIRSMTGDAPLSPTAHALLPSSLFMDDELPSPEEMRHVLGPSLFPDEERHSTESSSRSASHISSPRHSANNLFSTQRIAEDDPNTLNDSNKEFGAIGSPNAGSFDLKSPTIPKKSIQDLFTFPRNRGKTMQVDGPSLGSLKTGQSNSFPKQTDDGDVSYMRNRRTSFSTGITSFLSRGHSDVAEGNGPAMARNAPTRRRGFKMFGSSIDDPAVGHSDRDPSSPRPASIASSDLPRPSMDSNPFGWPVGGEAISRNSPLATNWSTNYGSNHSHPHPWGSHNPSRRPSIQHGSTSALGGVADADDDFLPPDSLAQQSSPPPVGVIGGPRPQSAKSQTPRLNPNAPAFMAMFGRSKTSRKDNSANEDHSTHDEAHSPSDSRKSKDSRSIHTQNSVAESYDSLDRTDSNAPSDLQITSQASKEGTETSFQKLFRKSSSSKFSIGSFTNRMSSKSKSQAGTPTTSSIERGSVGDLDEHGEDLLGRSMESATSSPMYGSIGGGSQSGTPRKSGWNRFSISAGRKGKDKSEKDVDASEPSLTSGAETTEDERED